MLVHDCLISRLVAFLAFFALTFATAATAAVTERSVYYKYDVAGRQLETHFDSATGADKIVNAYDGFGDLTSSQVSMGTFSKTLTSSYDVGGRRTQLAHPEGGTYSFQYCYDALDRLTTLAQGSNCTT